MGEKDRSACLIWDPLVQRHEVQVGQGAYPEVRRDRIVVKDRLTNHIRIVLVSMRAKEGDVDSLLAQGFAHLRDLTSMGLLRGRAGRRDVDKALGHDLRFNRATKLAA